MSDPTDPRNPVDRLAEEFVRRYRRGEEPDIESYAGAHPDLAEDIREVFPALVLMEELRPAETQTAPGPAPDPLGSMPERIGRYRIVRRLGHGGMGSVYEARSADAGDDDGRVAIKLIHGHLTEEGAFLQRFLREAEVGKRIDHPNVIRTLDAGIHEPEDDDEIPYLVLEYVEGRSLRELAEELGGAIPETLLRHLARQVARGLEHVHALGVVHRDIKPGNVMVTADNRIQIMDLGVARIEDATDRLSLTGQFIGSARYAAPEQFRPELGPVGPATDLYSLGVTFYELAVGKHPFKAQSPYGLMAAHVGERPPPAHEVSSEVSPFLSAVLAVLLEKDAAERFPDAAALRHVLDAGERSSWWVERTEESDA